MPDIEQPSRQTLDEAPAKVLTFLLGAAKFPVISSALAARGYDQAEADHAWSLLSTLGRVSQAPTPGGAKDEAVQKAITALDAWDEPNFAIIQATLERKYPDLVPKLFTDLEPQQGDEAVASVSTLLDRLDLLDKDTSASAKGAMKLLATRGYTKDERKRLRELVSTAKTISAASPPVTDADREQAIRDLYAWHREWSTIAKQVISRRQHLISLGLASPRKAKKKGPQGGGGGSGDPKPQ